MALGLRRVIPAVAGPLLIAGSVLVVLHAFAFGGQVSSQHPDLLGFWLPTYCLLGKSIAAGHIPAWNPHVMAGVPFAADPQSGWMYAPAMLLFGVFSCGTAMRLLVVVQPLLGGLGLYAFLRSEGLSRTAATSGGLALALGLSASRLGVFLPFPSSFAWTAALLAACSRYFRASSWPGRFVWAGLTAVAWGQLAGAYFAHGLVIGTLALAAYVIAKVVSKVRAGAWEPAVATRLLVLLVLAIPLVNLAVLLPRFAYLPRTTYTKGYPKLIQAGGVSNLDWPLAFATTPGAHLGATVLGLSFAGWRSRRLRPLALAFGSFGAVSYLLGIHPVGVRLSSLLKNVPVLGFYGHYPGRFSLGLVLAIPILGAVGVEAWREARTARDRALVMAPGIAVWFVLPAALGADLKELWLLLMAGAASAIVLALAAVRRPSWIAAIPIILAIELSTGALLGQAHPESPDSFQAGLSGWLVPLERPDVDATAYLRPGSIAQAIRREDRGRYLSFDPSITDDRGYLTRQAPTYWPLLANQRAGLFGLEDVQGYNPVQLRRYWNFVRAVDRSRIDYNSSFFTRALPAAIDLLDVRWVIVSGAPVLPGGQAVTEGTWMAVRESHVPGMASLLTSWKVASTPEAALRGVLAPGFDPQKEAIVEPGAVAGSPGIQHGEGTANYRPLGSAGAWIDLDAPSRGVLLIRIPFDDGWRATVDGKTATVFPADYVDQGVAVPAGRHTVILRYVDPWIGLGLLGSVLSLVALVAAALLSRPARREEARPGVRPSASPVTPEREGQGPP